MSSSHKLEDDLLATEALSERFFLESEFEGLSQGYWHLRQRSNGRFSAKPMRGYVPDLERIAMAQILLDNLNKQVAMGGAWVVAWVNNGDKLVMLWMDADGDVRFTVESFANEIFHPVADRRTEFGSLITSAYQAWAQWKHHMVDVMDPRPGVDHYRRALGEKPHSAR